MYVYMTVYTTVYTNMHINLLYIHLYLSYIYTCTVAMSRRLDGGFFAFILPLIIDSIFSKVSIYYMYIYIYIYVQ